LQFHDYIFSPFQLTLSQSPSSDKVQDVSTSNRKCAPTAASSFSRFNDLPAELRNRVVSEAVTSPAAITDLDMSGVNLGVLLTCKYFRAEGLKCLYENNILHFSSVETLEKVLEHGMFRASILQRSSALTAYQA